METELTSNFNRVYLELKQSSNPTAIAKRMGYSTTTQLNKTLDGKAQLSTKAIGMLVKNFNVNPTFLFTGESPMFLNEKPVTRFDYNIVSSTL